MRQRALFVVFGTWCAVALPAVARAQERPEVTAVVATYAEIMRELPAMLARGEQQSQLAMALEARMAEQVRAALPQLLTVVQQGSLNAAEAAAYSLKYATDADAAVGPLLLALERFGGRLANNASLALTHLCIEHPTLNIPLEPLARALGGKQWNQQQKVAQVVLILAERGTLADPEGPLAAALIPLLASQRQQVFGLGRSILPTITGQPLGATPEPWVRWYAQRYGRTIDLAAGIYELVQMVRPALRNGQETWSIEGTTYTMRDALVTRLKMDAESARRLNRKFGIAIQIPQDGFPRDRLMALAEAIGAISEVGVVLQPEDVEFVPFSAALDRLLRLLKESPPPR